MKKQELKNGMIVENREGDRYIVVNDLLFGLDSFNLLENYNDDLTLFSFNNLYIVKVYEIESPSIELSLNKVLKDTSRLKLLWERKEPLYFDARLSNRFKYNFRGNDKSIYLDCHGLTKEETKEKGYNWLSNMFTTEKPKPLIIIDGEVK